MAEIILHDAEIEMLLRDENGGLAAELGRVADRIIEKAKDNLSVLYVRGELNRPPGPPRLRTGDLRDSVQRQFAVNGPDGLFVDIFADAEHSEPRNDGQYGASLLEDGYIFITEDEIQSLAE